MSEPEVNSACVLSIGEEGTDKYLVGYVVLEGKANLSVLELKQRLKLKLPFYMVPSFFFFLDRFVYSIYYILYQYLIQINGQGS